MTCRATPLWRSGGWGVTFAPFAWEQASGPITLTDQGAVAHDPADEIGEDGGEMGDEGEEIARDGTRGGPYRGLAPHGTLAQVQVPARGCKAPRVRRPRAGDAGGLRQALGCGGDGGGPVPPVAATFGLHGVRRRRRVPIWNSSGAIRVLRIIASSAPEHARRLGADGVVTAAVQSAAEPATKPRRVLLFGRRPFVFGAR